MHLPKLESKLWKLLWKLCLRYSGNSGALTTVKPAKKILYAPYIIILSFLLVNTLRTEKSKELLSID